MYEKVLRTEEKLRRSKRVDLVDDLVEVGEVIEELEVVGEIGVGQVVLDGLQDPPVVVLVCLVGVPVGVGGFGVVPVAEEVGVRLDGHPTHEQPHTWGRCS